MLGPAAASEEMGEISKWLMLGSQGEARYDLICGKNILSGARSFIVVAYS
jgi:hypothetical protein